MAESGRRLAAIDLYQQVLEEDNSATLAWVGLGNMLDDESARREAFDKALTLDPENKEALNGLAVLDGNPIPFPAEKEEEIQEAPAPDSMSPSVDQPAAESSAKKVEPNIGGIFPHPVDISEFVLPDGSMVSYKSGDPTHLRCNRCGRPISGRDSKKTSVGYRCLICIHELEESFFEATSSDHLIAIAISSVLSLIAGIVVSRIGGFGGFFIYFIIFAIGGAIGTFIARTSHRAIGRRRGRHLPTIISGIVAAGGILPAIFAFLATFSLFGIIVPLIYAFTAASAAYYFLK